MGQLSPDSAEIERIASTEALPPEMEQQLLTNNHLTPDMTDDAAALALKFAEKNAPPALAKRMASMVAQQIIRVMLAAKAAAL
jgi:hypothetical protein